MLELWLNFTVVVSIQLILLVIYAHYTKSLSDLPRILVLGFLTGLGVGLISDLFWGKYLGLWSYELGFDVIPLTLSAILIYGLFATSVLLMRRARLVHFFIWIIAMTTVYETTNYYFRVWTYELPLPTYGILIFLVLGYFVTAIFIAVIWHFIFKQRFLLIDAFFHGESF